MPKVRYSTGVKKEMAEREALSGKIYELRLPGKHPLVVGKELTFRGERGRFKFRWAKETSDGYEVTVYGGTKRYTAWRTFTADRIKAVHYKEKLR